MSRNSYVVVCAILWQELFIIVQLRAIYDCIKNCFMSFYTFGDMGPWYDDELTDNIFVEMIHLTLPLQVSSLIARFMGPTWGLSGADRAVVSPMLAPWTLLSGLRCKVTSLLWQKIDLYARQRQRHSPSIFRNGKSWFKQIIRLDSVRQNHLKHKFTSK